MEMKLVMIVVGFLGIVQDAYLYPDRDLPYYDTMPTYCSPGKAFKYKCNFCICSQEGKPLGCTLISCLDFDALQDLPYNVEQEIDNNKIEEQDDIFRKRDAKFNQSRKKRAADNIYDDDQQVFLDENPSPRSFEQQQELAQRSYLQQQQAYYDQLQLQRDLEQERAELEAQQDEMESQLEYQQEQDAQQRAEDVRQQELDRQQRLLEQQQRIQEQQAQQKLDEQFYKNYKGYNRKYSSRRRQQYQS